MSIVDETAPTTPTLTLTNPESPEEAPGLMAGLSTNMKILMVAVMPLFLVTVFILCFVSAGHAPTPYHLPIVISGSEQVTSQIADKLVEATDEEAFTITTTTSAAEARDAVATREAAGSVVITDTGVTTYFATGAGAFQASTIKSVGTQIAGELNLPSKLTDVAPTPTEDPAGTSLFFFMVICTLGAFLSIVVMTMTDPKGRVTGRIAAVVGASLLGPTIGYSIISSFTGGFEIPFGTISAVVGVGMLYSVVIGLLTIVLARLAGLGGILIGMILLITMNFPSSGGSTAEATLPPFWQVIHNSWMGSAMVEWTRGITYFDGAQIDQWSAQLLIWAAAAVVALVIVVALQSQRPKLTARFRSTQTADAADPPRNSSAPASTVIIGAPSQVPLV